MSNEEGMILKRQLLACSISMASLTMVGVSMDEEAHNKVVEQGHAR